MEESNPSGSQSGASGNESEAVQNQNNNETSKGPVSYDSYAKAVSAEKSAKTKLREAEAKLAEIENETLKRSGNHEARAKKLEDDLAKATESFKSQTRTFATRNLENQLKAKLTAEGCIDADLALKAIDLSDIEFDDGFSIPEEPVKVKVSELVKTKPHLFKKDVKVKQNLTPTNKISTATSTATSLDDLWKEV